MGKRLSGWLQRISTGWVTLLALAIFVLFSVLVLPGQSEKAPGDGSSPDLSLVYTADDLYDMAESYGQEGRQAYIRARFTFDLVWPLVYAFFLVTAISWVFGRAFSPDSRWQRTNLLPVLGALFDYLENLSTSLVMIRFPAQTPLVDVLAPVFTFAKWALLGASFVLLLAGIVVAVWRRVRRNEP